MISYNSNKNDVQLSITERALAFINTQLKQRPEAKGIRLSVTTTGCSGYAYTIEPIKADEIVKDDLITEIQHITFYIDKQYYEKIYKGVEIDFIKKELGQSQLVFNNPNEKGQCGCGESFNI